MLNEVRREAFGLRKTKKSTVDDDKDDEDDEEDGEENVSSCPLSVEEWKNWYPQEWVGWVLYGTPSDKPTHHWVTQGISEGPSDEPTYFEDETGKKSSKKPPGRALQRERAHNETTTSRASSNSNTMLSHRILQSEGELKIAQSAHDLKMINLLRANADTDEKKEKVDEYYTEYLLKESDLLDERMRESRNQREKKKADEEKSLKRIVSAPSPINNPTESIPKNTPLASTPFDSDIIYPLEYNGLQNSEDIFSSQMEFSQENQSNLPSGSSVSNPTMDFSIISNSRDVRSRSTPSIDYAVDSSTSSLLPHQKSTLGRPPLPPAASTVLTRSRSPHKGVVSQDPIAAENPYRGKNWEDVNTALHRKYPMEEPGFISPRGFNEREGMNDLSDLKALKNGDIEDDEDLEMTQMWIRKLKFAIKQNMVESDSDSDDGSAYVDEDSF